MIFSNCPKIYQNLPSLFNLWTDKAIHVNLWKNCAIDLKKNNLYFLTINDWNCQYNVKTTPMNYTICMGCLGKWLFCNARVCLCFYGQLGTLLWRLCCDISIIAILRSLAYWLQWDRALFEAASLCELANMTAFGSYFSCHLEMAESAYVFMGN